MKKIWEKYKEIFIILLYVVAVAGLFRFAIQPLFSQITQKRNYAEEKTADQEIAKKKISELPQLRERMETVKQEEKKLEVFFKQDNALALIQKLESIAFETGNEIRIAIKEEDSSAGREAAKKSVSKEKDSIMSGLLDKDYLTMEISLEGDFNSTRKFVHRVENMDYFSDIVSLKIGKSVEEETVSGSISIFQEGNVPVEIVEDATVSKKYENPLQMIMEVVFYIEKPSTD